MVWADGDTLTRLDIEEALLLAFENRDEGILNRPLDGDLSLPDLISEVKRHYIQRAAEEFKEKKEAAKRLGLSRQTFNNWKKKCKG